MQRESDSGGAYFDVVALASSAGGLRALTLILSALPRDFPAAVMVVQHLDPHYPSQLAALISRRTELPTTQAEEGAAIVPGEIFIAPPNHHLLATPERTISLTRSELVHYVRPSADLLFESVAATYRDRAIAVVLTGTGADGSLGVSAIKKTGGVVIAQEPTDAEFRGMPEAAIQSGDVDLVLPLDAIAPALVNLALTGSK
jgi:two-component system, chemotaxis family, protein-glutamate methylesterase/glutaminase